MFFDSNRMDRSLVLQDCTTAENLFDVHMHVKLLLVSLVNDLILLVGKFKLRNLFCLQNFPVAFLSVRPCLLAPPRISDPCLSRVIVIYDVCFVY